MQLDEPATTVQAAKETSTGDVYVTPMHGAQPPSRQTAALVRFTPGARSHWHHHGLGQLLICTEGFGFVGTRDGSVIRLRAGESVWTPPGEEHPGTDEQYLDAHQTTKGRSAR